MATIHSFSCRLSCFFVFASAGNFKDLLDIFEICQRVLKGEDREHSSFNSTTNQVNCCSCE